jgi:hypothetical protein
MIPTSALSSRFADAVELAEDVHRAQRRTGTRIPYLARLLVVTGLVLEDGGSISSSPAGQVR